MGLIDTGTTVLNTPLFFSLCDNDSISPCIFSVFLTDEGGMFHQIERKEGRGGRKGESINDRI